MLVLGDICSNYIQWSACPQNDYFSRFVKIRIDSRIIDVIQPFDIKHIISCLDRFEKCVGVTSIA